MIGFGYWKETYNEDDQGVEGCCYNVFFLCWHYQLLFLQNPQVRETRWKASSGFQKRLEDALREQANVKQRQSRE